MEKGLQSVSAVIHGAALSVLVIGCSRKAHRSQGCVFGELLFHFGSLCNTVPLTTPGLTRLAQTAVCLII